VEINLHPFLFFNYGEYMKKELLNKLNIIANSVDVAKTESSKSNLYYDGYFDCIKDLLSDDNSFFMNLLEKKFEGKAKQEAYEDVSSLLSSLKVFIENLPEFSAQETTDFSIHPNERAQRFLERKRQG